MEKHLCKLLNNLKYDNNKNFNIDIEINKLCYDTRDIEKNDLFICIEGSRFDTHAELSQIIKKGVCAIVVNKNNKFFKDLKNEDDVIIIEVENTRRALAVISSNYFNNPSKKLKIIGITGTKGKTTTSFMIKSILEENGYKVGMIGTIGIFFGDKHIYTHNTTPESYILHKYFSMMYEEGIEFVVMEVSSQSLKYDRVYGIDFYFAIWTNIKPEHIGENEHENYEDYILSKIKIFSQCQNALINSMTDDYDRIIDTIKKYNVNVYKKIDNQKFNLLIPGDYNQENASLAYEFGKAVGISNDIIVKALEKTVVPGRIETVFKNNDFTIVVDYSYDPNGAKRFLETIKKLEYKRIITIFGCGGNRSKDRRYGMGEVCGQMADFVILTADNSRFEKTIDIIADIETTLTKYKTKNDYDNGYIILEDRREAIEFAIKNHKNGDIICVMGKGHEPYMEMNGKTVDFLDKKVILEIIKQNNIK